jgi:hypothetical protein
MQSVGIENVRLRAINILFWHQFHRSHSSLGVEHSLSKRKVVGSNPACGYFFGCVSQQINKKCTRDEDRTRDLVRVRHA